MYSNAVVEERVKSSFFTAYRAKYFESRVQTNAKFFICALLATIVR